MSKVVFSPSTFIGVCPTVFTAPARLAVKVEGFKGVPSDPRIREVTVSNVMFRLASKSAKVLTITDLFSFSISTIRPWTAATS